MFNVKWAIFQLYHEENKLVHVMNDVCFVLDKQAKLDYYSASSLKQQSPGRHVVLAHWNNSPLVDMSFYWDTLTWLQANQSLLLLLNTVYFIIASSRKYQFESLVWPIELTICPTQDDHATHNNTDCIGSKWWYLLCTWPTCLVGS